MPALGFETTKPPEQITVEQGTVGMNRKWLHYISDGGWVAAIGSVLAKKAAVGDQARIRAWNLARASRRSARSSRRRAIADCPDNARALFPDA